jgi:hypothetical protein
MIMLELDLLKQIVRKVIATRHDEIGCDDCLDQLDRFVDMKLAGKSAAEAMPLVEDHLERCRDCREEFETLLTVVQALA